MIYLDNNATTRVAPEVLDAMHPYLGQLFGNPSSAHALGREMKRAVEQSREQVASLIGAADVNEIVFTSCGSESDNWAIRGVLATRPEKKHIVTTLVEHEAVRFARDHHPQARACKRHQVTRCLEQPMFPHAGPVPDHRQ